MRNNILGGLVIFMVVVTCLLMIDDITKPQKQADLQDTSKIEQAENETNLAIVETED